MQPTGNPPPAPSGGARRLDRPSRQPSRAAGPRKPADAAADVASLRRLKARLAASAPGGGSGQRAPGGAQVMEGFEPAAPAREAPRARIDAAAAPPRRRFAGNSPRKRLLVTLPDDPPATDTTAAAQLALLVVVVNIFACLLAGQATMMPAAATDERPARAAVAAAPTLPTGGAAEEGLATRIAKMMFRSPGRP